MMKICFLSFEYPPFIIGGAGTYAKHLCRELAKIGHKVYVISSGTAPKPSLSTENGVTVYRIPIINKTFLKMPSYWLRLKKYYKIIEKECGGFDILHSNVTSDLTLTKKTIKTPRVVTIHHSAHITFMITNPSLKELILNPNSETGLAAFLEKKLIDFDKKSIEKADKIITVSNFVKQNLISIYKLPDSKISVIYNGIHPEDYECPENEVWKIKSMLNITNQPAILFVGRLEPRKGVHLLLKAFKLILKHKKCKLIITGSGKQNLFKKLAKSLNVEKQTIFTGYVSNTTLKKLYNACNVLVIPSLFEGFSITALEAMAAGKPIVASNIGGIPEIIKDGVHGKLVDPRKTEDLAEALMLFIDNPKLAEEIGEKNKKYVAENFKWEKTAKLTEKIYENLINEKLN